MHVSVPVVGALTAFFLLAAVPAAQRGGGEPWPLPRWPAATAAEMGMDEGKLRQAREYALTGGGSGYITRRGRLVMAWGDPSHRYDLKSTTKSIGVTALGLAIRDGKLGLRDPARRHHPAFGVPPESNRETGWLDSITLEHLARQTAGFEKPGGYGKLLFQPGTRWHYSDAGPNWLAECVTLAYRRDVNDLMFERVFTPLGIRPEELTWRRNAYRPAEIEGLPRREFGSGIHASVDAMARIGYLYLRNGQWNGQEILPRRFVETARAAVPASVAPPVSDPDQYGSASRHYGLLWWNNADGALPGVPRDAYWSWGLHESLIVVIPSLDIVVSRAGGSWKRTDGQDHYSVLRPFLEPIVTAAGGAALAAGAGPPYPQSPVLAGLEWAPPATIRRAARGGDNWPLTWGDDDALYTAYGDGNGFDPMVPEKLSMGFARITGPPDAFRAENIRSPSGETVGDGPAGKKGSGMLMVDGVLYLWARNAGNSQLAWSADRGRTWTWSDWKLTTSFGCPTFLNFGKNYAGARDEFVYIYSHDSDSAYAPADRMVLARVPRTRVRDRAAYEFFRDLDRAGRPRWTREVTERGAVFSHSGRCYRSGVSYNAGLRRYLWVQIIPGPDTRYTGGFGVYDAPEPWGPWTTVYHTEGWDVGPGETASFPPRWMSADGRTLHLVFSGDDHFSVRRAMVKRIP